MGAVLGLRRALPDHFGLSAISLIAPHSRFFAVQQIGQYHRIGYVGRRRHRRVDDLRLAIHPHVRLHPEVASRLRELPPQPLSDPYVTLSRHTAPVIQPYPQLHANDETIEVRRPSSCAAI